MSKFKWQYSRKYLAHLAMIMATMFVSYPIGNWILNFQAPINPVYNIIKMFLWFYPILFLADNVFENYLNV